MSAYICCPKCHENTLDVDTLMCDCGYGKSEMKNLHPLGKCSHGVSFNDPCRDCEIVSHKQLIDWQQPMVERAKKRLEQLTGDCWTAACIPENCRLKAHFEGEGWLLYVVDKKGEVLCYLDWPKAWSTTVGELFIEQCGFEIEP